MNKFHVEEAKIQEIFVSKNRIYYDFVLNYREQCYVVTNNEFNHPLLLLGLCLETFIKVTTRCGFSFMQGELLLLLLLLQH